MNMIFLTGHVGQEPQKKTFENNRQVLSFSLATNKRYKSADGEVKETPTQWHNIQVWGYLAEVPIERGSLVHAVGELQYREYTDKDGIKRWSTDIVISNTIPNTSVHIIRKFAKTQAPPITADMDPMVKRQPVTADGFTQPAAVAAPDGAFFKSEIPASASPDTDLPF